MAGRRVRPAAEDLSARAARGQRLLQPSEEGPPVRLLPRPGPGARSGHLPLTVFTCLSHDIIAHETTHALLDGMHRRFNEPSNPDVLAFHEAFADIVALFQHFSLPEVLRHQVAATRGDLESQNRLGELAQQFGQATGKRGPCGSAWARSIPRPASGNGPSPTPTRTAGSRSPTIGAVCWWPPSSTRS